MRPGNIRLMPLSSTTKMDLEAGIQQPVREGQIKLVIGGMADRFHGDEGLKEPMNPFHVDGL